jgi:hypothetical protein
LGFKVEDLEIRSSAVDLLLKSLKLVLFMYVCIFKTCVRLNVLSRITYVTTYVITYVFTTNYICKYICIYYKLHM